MNILRYHHEKNYFDFGITTAVADGEGTSGMVQW